MSAGGAKTERERLIAYDPDLRRPGCVLIAAVLGADTTRPHAFPTHTWLLSPTPGMRLLPITDDRLELVVTATIAAHPELAPEQATSWPPARRKCQGSP